MTEKEAAEWTAYMKTLRGRWSVDPIHNGEDDNDLLLFHPNLDDPTLGVYVRVQGAQVSAGRFSEAIPHMGEALYVPAWEKEYGSENEAMSAVINRVGVNALLALIDGASPYVTP